MRRDAPKRICESVFDKRNDDTHQFNALIQDGRYEPERSDARPWAGRATTVIPVTGSDPKATGLGRNDAGGYWPPFRGSGDAAKDETPNAKNSTSEFRVDQFGVPCSRRIGA
jgi:hypothetical protein